MEASDDIVTVTATVTAIVIVIVVVGISDCLRCFWCGGGLQDWKSGETPYHEHARWFPSCEFLVQQKGQSYVENVLQCEEDRQAGHQVKR